MIKKSENLLLERDYMSAMFHIETVNPDPVKAEAILGYLRYQ